MGKKTYAEKLSRKQRTSVLYRLICRTVLFVFLMSLTTFIMYLCGNFQRFLDSSLRYLLWWGSINCVLLVILGLFALVLSVVMFFATFRVKYWIYFFINILVMAVAVVGFVLAYVLTFVSAGVE